jgi:hypothetical protein
MIARHPDFQGILAAVRAARPGPVFVLGAVDCGKTTLVRPAAVVSIRRRARNFRAETLRGGTIRRHTFRRVALE